MLTADCCRQMPQFSYCWACQFEQPTTRDMMAASLKKDSQVMVLPVTLRSTDVPAAGNQWQRTAQLWLQWTDNSRVLSSTRVYLCCISRDNTLA